MTVSELKAALDLAIADGHGSKTLYQKSAAGSVELANVFKIVLGDYEYFPDNVGPSAFGVIEALVP